MPHPAGRPLSLAALDAAISESIGRPVRRDRLERDDRVFRWIIRRAEREGDCFRTTYAEAAKGAGYDVDPLVDRAARKTAKRRRVSTIRRAFDSLATAALIEVHGLQKENGQWRCLEVRVRRYARGTPPCGRSGRARRVSSVLNARPARHRGQPSSRARASVHRISFSDKSGYSPAVGPSDQTTTQRGLTRARARTADRDGAPGARSAPRIRGSRVRRLLESRGDDWPIDVFEPTHEALVELCDVFEASFERPARFSFRRHGERLTRILARFDRFAGLGENSYRAGLREAKVLIEAMGEEARDPSRGRRGTVAGPWRHGGRLGPHQGYTEIGTLAYFIPILDEMSKAKRRHWRLHQNPDR